MNPSIKVQEGTKDTADRAPAPRARRPYRSPSLVTYGDLVRLTLAKGGTKGDQGAQATRM
jgi:hypothetical protein